MSALEIIQLIQVLGPLVQVTEPLIKEAVNGIIHAIAHAASSNKTLQSEDVAQHVKVVQQYLSK